MKTHIRPALHTDATQIIHTHRRSIREVCGKDYTPEQVEAWAGRKFEESRWITSMDTEFVWVVEFGGEVSGFGHISQLQEDSVELRGLYFLPDVLGMGQGKLMMEIIFNQARKLGAKRMKLHATITALTFYEKFGFQKMASSGPPIQMQGVTIPCHPMEKLL